MKYCPNCGEPFEAGQKFCGNCGAPIVDPGSSFCDSCGSKL